jgi:hypothetical protein
MLYGTPDQNNFKQYFGEIMNRTNCNKVSSNICTLENICTIFSLIYIYLFSHFLCSVPGNFLNLQRKLEKNFSVVIMYIQGQGQNR